MRAPNRKATNARFRNFAPPATRTVCTLLVCMLSMLLLSSCWSQRELSSLAIVVGAALDKGEEEDTIKLTAQVIRAADMGGGSSASSSGEKAYVNISGTGRSVLSAVRGTIHHQSRKLYFPHSDVLIFGSELAKAGIESGLDAFIRDYEGRMNVFILVAKNTGAEILEEEVDFEKSPCLHITNMMGQQKGASQTVVITLRDFVIATLSQSTCPVAPMIEIKEVDGKKQAWLEGTAIFKDDKMVGQLDKDETRGFLWLTDKVDAGDMTVDTQWGSVSLEVLHAQSSLSAEKGEDGKIRMRLKVVAEGLIQSNHTKESMTEPEKVDMLNGKMAENIRQDIERTHAVAVGLDTDIFGFGDVIRRSFPKEWEGMRDNWGQHFGEVPLELEIQTELRSTGSLKTPANPGGAQ